MNNYTHYKENEFYVDFLHGIFYTIEIHKPEETLSRLKIGTVHYFDSNHITSLYENSRTHRVATDEDIKEFLNQGIGCLELDEGIRARIDKDGLSISSEDNFVLLNKKQTLSLKEFLNREIV